MKRTPLVLAVAIVVSSTATAQNGAEQNALEAAASQPDPTTEVVQPASPLLPLTFTASETFDVGLDTLSPVADGYFDKAPFKFDGKLKRLYFENLQDERPAFKRSPDDD